VPDGSHGYADFLAIKKLLLENDRRVCIFDRAGLGWSD